MKSLLVETTPRNYDRNVNTINYGQEIVRKKLDADVMHWADLVNVRFYDIIGFNVFYPINVINMTAFLKQHDLLDKENRRQTIIAGGQGVSNLKGIIDPLVDSIFKGEIDGEVVNGHVFHRRLELDTPEMSNHERGVVELTRGCKYSCAFCEYGCKVGGPYREKPIELVKEQMLRLKRSGIGTINFMSANLGGYSDVLELIDHCLWNGIRIANTDSCLSDLTRLDELLPTMSSVRVGVESLCADTRRAIQKPSGGRSLVETMEYLFRKTNGVHMYLIYGLPNENYDEWFKELAEIKKVMSAYDREEQGLFGPIMEYDKNIRLDFSFTQFEPCVGTPLEDAPLGELQRAGRIPEGVAASRT